MANKDGSVARDGAGSSKGGSVGKKLSLILLTFQNSALILVMHYSRIMPMSGDHRYFTSTAVFLNELIKLAVSLSMAMYETSKTLAPSTPATVLIEQIYNGVFRGDGWKLALPAVFYTLQNMLQFVAVENLDAVHFQVLYQLKIITTAIFTVIMLNRPLGMVRWASLVILTLGVSVVSLPSSSMPKDSFLLHGIPDHFFPRSQHELGHQPTDDGPDVHLTRRSASYEGIADDLPVGEAGMNYSVGFTAVLIAAAVSGLAGVYFEKLLKESPTQVSVWIRNVQLSFYSVIAAFFGGIVWQEGEEILKHGAFDGYNWIVWVTILLQAAGGLIASLVIRDADNIVKNFATSISIVISFVVSLWLFDFKVSFNFLLGTSLVLVAVWLYNTQEHGLKRPQAVRLFSFEKHTIDRGTPLSTPRTTDLRKLNTDPFDLKGLASTSSRPSSPGPGLTPRQISRSIPRSE